MIKILLCGKYVFLLNIQIAHCQHAVKKTSLPVPTLMLNEGHMQVNR